jgi:hypothetical protein
MAKGGASEALLRFTACRGIVDAFNGTFRAISKCLNGPVRASATDVAPVVTDGQQESIVQTLQAGTSHSER